MQHQSVVGAMDFKSALVAGVLGALIGSGVTGTIQERHIQIAAWENEPDPEAFFVTESNSPGFPCRLFPDLEDSQESAYRYVVSRLGGSGSTWIELDDQPTIRVERQAGAWVVTAWKNNLTGERMNARRFVIADGLLCEDGTVWGR